ncbi:MAG: cyclic nucleotide-binding domain-containing protein, partial [Myxococcota bacterium]|nr:cyclic nucleotide-binding domain-containing protein [Myxococcota bacterium]
MPQRISMGVLQDVLATAPLFSNFAEEDLLAFASAMRERRLTADQVLFREGQQGDAMVLVVSGELIVVSEEIKGQTVELARIGVGDIVGEMSAIDPAPRSATVKALGPATVYVLDRTMLGALMSNAPSVYASLLHGIGRAVTDRLSLTNTRIRREAFGHLDVPPSLIARLDEASGRSAAAACDPSTLEPLEGFTERERTQLLTSTPLVAFDDGDILCAEGRSGQSCFIIGG